MGGHCIALFVSLFSVASLNKSNLFPLYWYLFSLWCMGSRDFLLSDTRTQVCSRLVHERPVTYYRHIEIKITHALS